MLCSPFVDTFRWSYEDTFFFLKEVIIIIIIIIIYPLTARVVGAPHVQMISQPVSSIFPCFPGEQGKGKYWIRNKHNDKLDPYPIGVTTEASTFVLNLRSGGAVAWRLSADTTLRTFSSSGGALVISCTHLKQYLRDRLAEMLVSACFCCCCRQRGCRYSSPSPSILLRRL